MKPPFSAPSLPTCFRAFPLLAIGLTVCGIAVPVHAESLRTIKIVNNRAIDCSSLQSIVRDVTRGCRTDDAKAIALYNFCRYACYHHAYPNEAGGISALKLFNVYGWGLCGGQHTAMAALWNAAGYKWRYRGWSSPGHTTVEVFYGGRWHYLDAFLKFYTWMPDPNAPGGRTIAGQEDILANPELVTRALTLDPTRKIYYHHDNQFDYVGESVNWQAPAFLVCGDALSSVISGIRSSRNSGSPRAWGTIKFDDSDYSTSVDLAAGYSLTLNWTQEQDAFYFRGRETHPRHTCGDKDFRNCPSIGPLLEPYHASGPARTWSNGRLVFKPNFGDGSFLSNVASSENVVYESGALRPTDPKKPGVLVVEMASPYVVARATAKIDSEGAKVDVSPDRKTWKPAKREDLTESTAGLYRYFVRISLSAPVKGLELTSVVQHNHEALPFLAPGENRITVDGANPKVLGKNRLVVTYAYYPGHRERSPAELADRDANIARAHFASWSNNPVVVRKTIESFPTTFTIRVPTPKGKQPVYPRMSFVRREVLAQGQSPQPVPALSTDPTVAQSDTLATLPSPWLIGTTPPPKRPSGQTETTTHLPVRTSYVSKKGEVFEQHFVKWLKDDSDAWILLADFGDAELPEAKALAGAKLVLSVHEAHNRAPMQAAVVALNKPFESGKSFDFSNLGSTVGTTVVGQGNGPGAPFTPPRRYEIDITRSVRRWCRGEPSHGLAIRIVPNRSIDDGWTVRFTPTAVKPLELQITHFVSKH
ncbi:MAG: hypothetical protein CMJ48_04360 [Planctomycetaceae bacterium]|nr:hypothetical protein [Planctomycetaceae bacterium]